MEHQECGLYQSQEPAHLFTSNRLAERDTHGLSPQHELVTGWLLLINRTQSWWLIGIFYYIIRPVLEVFEYTCIYEGGIRWLRAQ